MSVVHDDVCYIVLAAGESRRFGAPKMLTRLVGKSLLWWSLRAPIKLGLKVVLALPPDEALRVQMKRTLREEMDDEALERISFVIGGRTRQESSLRALQHTDTEYVLIHDGARPFASENLILRVISELKAGKAKGVVPAVPAYETVRLITDEGYMLLPRERVMMAQTPQGFQREALLEAHEVALRKGTAVTDDAALLEEAGYQVSFIDGELLNLKLTYREMLPAFQGIAEYLMSDLRGKRGESVA